MSPYQYSTKIARELVYKYMKLNDIKSKFYNYHSFFDYYIEELNILVMEHTFDNQISGLSIIDKNNRSSISYHKDHSTNRQNFTKCHELGHFLLNHEGLVFTESNENTVQEHEANYFASFILAPDIVLLYKINYANQSFKSIQNDLGISKDALKLRIQNLLKDYCNLNNEEINILITDFQCNKNSYINLCLTEVKDKIINDFQSIKINSLDNCLNQLHHHHYINSINSKELTNKTFQNNLKEKNKNLQFDSYFNYGKNIIYTWDQRYLNSVQALNNTKKESIIANINKN